MKRLEDLAVTYEKQYPSAATTSYYSVVVAALGLMCGCGGSHASIPSKTTYRVIDLDAGVTFPQIGHFATAISSNGAVAGSDGWLNHSFLYSQGVMTDLGLLPGASSSKANAINSSKQIVGYCILDRPLGHPHACEWANGILIDLNPPGSESSAALGISDDGLIIGSAQWGADFHAILWKAGRQPVDLGTINHVSGHSQANALNRFGQIVGYSSFPGGLFTHAFLWQNGEMTDLDRRPQGISEAFSINDSGQVVGYRELEGVQRATLWRNGSMVDLGVLPIPVGTLTRWSWAFGINNKGQIVGSTGTAGSLNGRAFIWQNGTMTDLNTLIPPSSGYVIENATGINDQGQIVGQASRSDGSGHAVLLNPQ